MDILEKSLASCYLFNVQFKTQRGIKIKLEVGPSTCNKHSQTPPSHSSQSHVICAKAMQVRTRCLHEKNVYSRKLLRIETEYIRKVT